MNTKYKVTGAGGELLGIFPKGEMAELKAFVAANPGAKVKPIVTTDNPCPMHTAYEADNCPACGTSTRVGLTSPAQVLRSDVRQQIGPAAASRTRGHADSPLRQARLRQLLSFDPLHP